MTASHGSWRRKDFESWFQPFKPFKRFKSVLTVV